MTTRPLSAIQQRAIRFTLSMPVQVNTLCFALFVGSLDALFYDLPRCP
jgi:hypothetical protein